VQFVQDLDKQVAANESVAGLTDAAECSSANLPQLQPISPKIANAVDAGGTLRECGQRTTGEKSTHQR